MALLIAGRWLHTSPVGMEECPPEKIMEALRIKKMFVVFLSSAGIEEPHTTH
jgi:hypothetical protein